MSHTHFPAQIALLNGQTRLPVLADIAVRFAVAVTTWDTRRKTRCALKSLDAHLLRDVGLASATAHAEATKPFWQD